MLSLLATGLLVSTYVEAVPYGQYPGAIFGRRYVGGVSYRRPSTSGVLFRRPVSLAEACSVCSPGKDIFVF